MKSLLKSLIFLSVSVLLLSAGFVIWIEQKQSIPFSLENIPKIKGVCFVGGRHRIDSSALAPIKNLGAEWICLMPYAFSRADSAKIRFNQERQWWGEKTQGIAHTVALAREKGLKIMLKPHLWLHWDGFTGHFGFEDSTRWQRWEQDYEAYVLHFAQLADSLKIELFCVGTELERFTRERPEFWEQLIAKVRKLYSGKLTYAANWDEYSRFPFWDKLDYIGIDAYFPLCEEQNPNLKTLLKVWDKTYKELESFSRKHQKAILFTEYGYRSTDYTAQRPWESYRELSPNQEAQSIALDALLQKFSGASWHAGGFLWKWFEHQGHFEGREDTDYSPQNKIAENTVRKWYLKKP